MPVTKKNFTGLNRIPKSDWKTDDLEDFAQFYIETTNMKPMQSVLISLILA